MGFDLLDVLGCDLNSILSLGGGVPVPSKRALSRLRVAAASYFCAHTGQTSPKSPNASCAKARTCSSLSLAASCMARSSEAARSAVASFSWATLRRTSASATRRRISSRSGTGALLRSMSTRSSSSSPARRKADSRTACNCRMAVAKAARAPESAADSAPDISPNSPELRPPPPPISVDLGRNHRCRLKFALLLSQSLQASRGHFQVARFLIGRLRPGHPRPFELDLQLRYPADAQQFADCIEAVLIGVRFNELAKKVLLQIDGPGQCTRQGLIRFGSVRRRWPEYLDEFSLGGWATKRDFSDRHLQKLGAPVERAVDSDVPSTLIPTDQSYLTLPCCRVK